MELRKHFDWRYAFIGLYFLAFAIYIIVGLQPAQATEYEKTGEITIPSIGLRSETMYWLEVIQKMRIRFY